MSQEEGEEVKGSFDGRLRGKEDSVPATDPTAAREGNDSEHDQVKH